MTFLKFLANNLKCAFCKNKLCFSRYKLGTTDFYSGSGLVLKECPKKNKKK